MHAPLHVVVVLLCVVVGASSVFGVFSVFFSILRLFSSTLFAPVLWCFSRSLLVFFVGSLEAVCFRCTLLLVFHVCWLVSSVVSSFLSMPTTRPTFNSLSADLFSTPSTSAPPSSGDSVGVSTVASGTSNSLSNEIAVAVAQAFLRRCVSRGESRRPGFQCGPSPCFQRCIQRCFQCCFRLGHGCCQLAFLCCRYIEVAALCVYVSRHFLHPRLLLGLPGSFDRSSDYGVACYLLFFARRKFSSVRRQGVCGWSGSRTHPSEIGEKITSGEFVELADLLSTNLRAVNLEPQSFLDGKLLVSKKRRLVEVEDILTWTEAFTIYQMVICASHPHRWSDLTKYKLLIIQTARHSPGRWWLEYDVAFRKDAVATGASDWSRMNLDLYNFHLRSPPPPSSLPSSSGLPLPVTTSRGNSARPRYCNSWNRGQCLWPFGDCRFRHSCNSCNGDHPRVRCPFHSPGTIRSRSPSPASGGRP